VGLVSVGMFGFGGFAGIERSFPGVLVATFLVSVAFLAKAVFLAIVLFLFIKVFDAVFL
jgi:hypothetical protein